MNKDELLAKFQRLGKVLMTPVLILPIAVRNVPITEFMHM